MFDVFGVLGVLGALYDIALIYGMFLMSLICVMLDDRVV